MKPVVSSIECLIQGKVCIKKEKLEKKTIVYIYSKNKFKLHMIVEDNVYINIYDISLREEDRGKGIGTKIIKLIINYARKKGYSHVIISEIINPKILHIAHKLAFSLYYKNSILINLKNANISPENHMRYTNIVTKELRKLQLEGENIRKFGERTNTLQKCTSM